MDDARIVAERWLSAFETALTAGSESALRSLFASDSHWRDLVAFTWTITPSHGREEIARLLLEGDVCARGFEISPRRTAPRAVQRIGRSIVEAFADFHTSVGKGTAVLRLVRDESSPAGYSAWILLTALMSLDTVERPGVGTRLANYGFERESFHDSWTDFRAREARFADREPQVLVIGAGQSGLSIAARLKDFGVDALVIERNPRVGDNWRNRYRTLNLHNPTFASHLPYLPFPAVAPKLLSRDYIADWLEFYAFALCLNVWTDTEMLDAHFDEEARRWTVTVRQQDGSERVLHPEHVVMAAGFGGNIPNLPELPGLNDFQGITLHTRDYHDATPFAGKRALIVGVGTSAHDVAHDLAESGAEVVMLQRSPITIISLEASELSYSLLNEGTPLDDADLLSASNLISSVFVEAAQRSTKVAAEIDAELLAGLERVGLRIDMGTDRTGFQAKAYRKHSGYYINVGASELLIDGRVKLMQHADLETLTPNGVRMQDGQELPFDAVIFATGFKSLATDIERMFGPEVAALVPSVFMLEESGEFSNVWIRTAQPHLWFMLGGLAHTRLYSRVLALQIRASLDGLMPPVAGALEAVAV